MAERRRLTFRFLEGDALTDEVVRELWELRLTYLTLSKSREEDWAFFRAFLSRDDASAFVFRDPDGVVQGFFTIALLPMEIDGTRGLLMYSKYFYFHTAYRGHPMSTIAPWVLLPIAVKRYGLRWLYFCTTTFPQSFVSLSRGSGNAYALRDADIPTWQRKALSRFAETFYPDDFVPDRGIITRQNVADENGVARGREAEALRERYEALNPRWREGESLPIIFRVDGTLIATNVRRNIRRMRR